MLGDTELNFIGKHVNKLFWTRTIRKTRLSELTILSSTLSVNIKKPDVYLEVVGQVTFTMASPLPPFNQKSVCNGDVSGFKRQIESHPAAASFVYGRSVTDAFIRCCSRAVKTTHGGQHVPRQEGFAPPASLE